MCRSTARFVTSSFVAIQVLLRPSAIIARISRSRGVSFSSPGSCLARVGDELVDDARIDQRAAGDDLPQRASELVLVPDPLLEQVRPLGRAVLEQAHRVGRLRMLAEHDHADVGMRRPQLAREAECPRRCWSAASGCRSRPRPASRDRPWFEARRDLRRRPRGRRRGSSRARARSPRGRESCRRPERRGSRRDAHRGQA